MPEDTRSKLPRDAIGKRTGCRGNGEPQHMSTSPQHLDPIVDKHRIMADEDGLFRYYQMIAGATELPIIRVAVKHSKAGTGRRTGTSRAPRRSSTASASPKAAAMGGSGAGKLSFPQARASWPESHAWESCPMTSAPSSSIRTSTSRA